MALVLNVLDIRRTAVDPEQVWGFSIDFVRPGDPGVAYAIVVGGWVLSRSCPAAAILLASNGTAFHQVRLGVPRPDIAALYPEVAWAGESGFYAGASVPGVTPEIDIYVDVTLYSGNRISLGVLHAQRSWRDSQ